MKSTKTIAVFAIVLVALSMLIVSALGVKTTNNQAANKSSVLSNNILPMPQIKNGNFIMWTSDGKNLMWGTYKLNPVHPCQKVGDLTLCKQGEGYGYIGTFNAMDNMGNKLRGNFARDSFSGYYIGNSGSGVVKAFSGSYENGTWKATGLFGQKESEGEYKFFPIPIVIQSQNNVYTL